MNAGSSATIDQHSLHNGISLLINAISGDAGNRSYLVILFLYRALCCETCWPTGSFQGCKGQLSSSTLLEKLENTWRHSNIEFFVFVQLIVYVDIDILYLEK